MDNNTQQEERHVRVNLTLDEGGERTIEFAFDPQASRFHVSDDSSGSQPQTCSIPETAGKMLDLSDDPTITAMAVGWTEGCYANRDHQITDVTASAASH